MTDVGPPNTEGDGHAAVCSNRPAGRTKQSGTSERRKQAIPAVMVTLAVVVASVWSPQAASAARDMCVAANGAVRHQSGTATCSADGRGSTARARGSGSNATATGGDRNRARVRGDNSSAFAGNGDGNTATADGDGCRAVAVGDGETNSCR